MKMSIDELWISIRVKGPHVRPRMFMLGAISFQQQNNNNKMYFNLFNFIFIEWHRFGNWLQKDKWRTWILGRFVSCFIHLNYCLYMIEFRANETFWFNETLIIFLLLFVHLAFTFIHFIHTICEPLVRATKFQTLFRIVQVRTVREGKWKHCIFFFFISRMQLSSLKRRVFSCLLNIWHSIFSLFWGDYHSSSKEQWMQMIWKEILCLHVMVHTLTDLRLFFFFLMFVMFT